MDLSKFCPVCGKEAGRLYGDKKMCGQCFLERNRLLDIPDEASIQVCEECGRMKQDGKWHPRFKDRDRVDLYFSQFDEDTDIEYGIERREENLRIDYTVSKKGLEDSGNVIIESSEDICRDCKGFEGGFTKSKIQVRGENLEEISGLIDQRCKNLEAKNHDDYLVNRREVKEGFDYHLSTEHMCQHVIKAVTKRFDLDVLRSYQLIGKKNGKEVYRNTAVLRKV